MMWEDPIVEEIRRGRIAHAKAFDFDLKAIVADYRAREEGSDRNFVENRPKPPIVYAPRKDKPASPFDVPGIDTSATTQDILDAIRESRAGYRTDPSDEADME